MYDVWFYKAGEEAVPSPRCGRRGQSFGCLEGS